jgi:hypothetical protein
VLDKLLGGAGYCHAVHCIVCIVEYRSGVIDHSVRMLSMMAVLGPHEVGIRICLGAQGGSQISTGREDIPGGSADVPTLSEGFQI